MGIKSIKLGAKSRALREPEAEPDEVQHPPLPGPANPTSIRGCGCGKWHIPPGADSVVVEGALHRYSATCKTSSGDPLPVRRSYESWVAEALSLRDEVRRQAERIEFLEAALQIRDERPASAWEEASEPEAPPVAGQDPYAAGLPRRKP